MINCLPPIIKLSVYFESHQMHTVAKVTVELMIILLTTVVTMQAVAKVTEQPLIISL